MLLHQPIDYHAERRLTHAAISAHDFSWDYTLVARPMPWRACYWRPGSRQRIG